MTMSIRQLEQPEARLLPALRELLQDAVHGGASIGFLAPLSDEEAGAYWGKVVGSVQLAPCLKPNGRHRVEIQKLFVHRLERGRGISARLMQAAEAGARSLGCSLMVLDTEAGSLAASVYEHLGWTRVGEIPDFALTPTGVLHPTVYFYKQLEPDEKTG